MSQKKVDQYKYEKAHRKEIMQKQKKKDAVRRVVIGVLAVVLVAWLGYSAVNQYQDSQPREAYEVDYTAVSEYVEGLE